MITAGIDCGSKNTKVVLLKENSILSTASVLSGFDQEESAVQALNSALEKAAISREDIKHITVTGAGMEAISFANDNVTTITSDGRGAHFLFPSARTVIDIGAEEGLVAKIDDKGKVKDFGINEKCAAGAGAFIEAMSRALEVDIETMGELSLKSTKQIPMNAQCTIFAESEVVSLIHQKTSKEDIIRAVHDAIADRNTSMVRQIGIEQDVALIGGVANNIGFVDAMNKNLGFELLVPKDGITPEYVSALGAALIAQDKIGGSK
ncbi:MAG: acyl-CoA dehydratase activase [Promethearchaeota archaeon]|jgi:benzoyl-CoA reductase subunit D